MARHRSNEVNYYRSYATKHSRQTRD